MPALTTLNIFLAYLGIAYVVGLVWFMLIERKDGFLKWRVIASVCSPLAVPLLFLAGIALKGLDVFLSWRKST